MIDTTIRVHDLIPEFIPAPPIDSADGAIIRLCNNGSVLRIEGTIGELEKFVTDFHTAVLDAKEVITNPLPRREVAS